MLIELQKKDKKKINQISKVPEKDYPINNNANLYYLRQKKKEKQTK